MILVILAVKSVDSGHFWIYNTGPFRHSFSIYLHSKVHSYSDDISALRKLQHMHIAHTGICFKY